MQSGFAAPWQIHDQRSPIAMKRLIRLPQTLPSWPEIISEFMLFKRASGCADRTLRDYKTHLSKFFETYDESEDLKIALFRHFADLAERVSPCTFNIRRRYLRAFFNWCKSEGYMAANPLSSIKRAKEDETPRCVNEDDLRRLLETCDQKTYTGLRDYCVLLLTLDTGIRPREALSLPVDALDLRNRAVTIPANIAKTRVSRTVPITPITARMLRKLLAIRPPEWNKSPLFCSQDGSEMLSSSWARRLSHYSEKAGVKIRPYDLRHAFALFYLRNGGNLLALQKTMGHTTLDMTRRYVALVEGDLQEQHSIASPVAKLVPEKKRVRTLK